MTVTVLGIGDIAVNKTDQNKFLFPHEICILGCELEISVWRKMKNWRKMREGWSWGGYDGMPQGLIELGLHFKNKVVTGVLVLK